MGRAVAPSLPEYAIVWHCLEVNPQCPEKNIVQIICIYSKASDDQKRQLHVFNKDSAIYWKKFSVRPTTNFCNSDVFIFNHYLISFNSDTM